MGRYTLEMDPPGKRKIPVGATEDDVKDLQSWKRPLHVGAPRRRRSGSVSDQADHRIL